jgi:kexin
MSSVPFFEEEKEKDWQVTGSGRLFSHQFGFGRLDAFRMIEVAKKWKPVRKHAWYFSPWVYVDHQLPQGDQGLASTIEVTAAQLKQANLARIEHVTITMNVAHGRRGDLSVELRSPIGVVSHLATARRNDEDTEGYNAWVFMSVAHFGETGVGNWTVIVKDTIVNEHTGTFKDYKLRLWGESIDGSTQPDLPMPTKDDDDDKVTTTILPSTTSIVIPPTTLPSVTTGLPTRPTKIPKPGDKDNQPSTPTSTPSPSDSFLPSIFPTFGVSKRTQIWVYGAIGLILAFVACLGLYFYMQRRKRLQRNPRENYEFAMLDAAEDFDETDGMLESMNGGAGGKKGRKKRAGELYDAFAGESDDELFSDDEAYRDVEDDELLSEKGDDDVRRHGGGG